MKNLIQEMVKKHMFFGQSSIITPKTIEHELFKGTINLEKSNHKEFMTLYKKEFNQFIKDLKENGENNYLIKVNSNFPNSYIHIGQMDIYRKSKNGMLEKVKLKKVCYVNVHNEYIDFGNIQTAYIDSNGLIYTMSFAGNGFGGQLFNFETLKDNNLKYAEKEGKVIILKSSVSEGTQMRILR